MTIRTITHHLSILIVLSPLLIASCSTSKKVARTEEQYETSDLSFRDSLFASEQQDRTTNSQLTMTIEREYLPISSIIAEIYAQLYPNTTDHPENAPNTPFIAVTDACKSTEGRIREQEKQNLEPFGSDFWLKNGYFGMIKEKIAISYGKQDSTHAEKGVSFASQSTFSSNVDNYSTSQEETQHSASNQATPLGRLWSFLSSSWQLILIVLLFLAFYRYVLPFLRKAYKILHVLFGR